VLLLGLGGGGAAALADDGAVGETTVAPVAPVMTPAPAPVVSATVTTPAPAPPPAVTSTVPAPPPAATATAPAPADVGRVVATRAVGVAGDDAVGAAPPRARASEVASTSTASARAAATDAVSIADFSFAPKALTVTAGDTVTWLNDGAVAHTATGRGFDTGSIASGQRGSHTFTAAGTFAYHCTIHPLMKGTVTVVAAASGDAGSDQTTAPAPAPAPVGADSTPPPPPTGSSTGSLPLTGWDLGSVALGGAALLLLGLLLRARARPR
jgi:plastocyanin